MQGDYDLALKHLRELRWEQPGQLWPCLEFARIARRTKDWAAALEALRWAKLKHVSDPLPYVALAETHLEMGQPLLASAVVDELAELVGPESGEVLRLRRAIASRSRARTRPS